MADSTRSHDYPAGLVHRHPQLDHTSSYDRLIPIVSPPSLMTEHLDLPHYSVTEPYTVDPYHLGSEVWKFLEEKMGSSNE